jgi:hypothetical protein
VQQLGITRASREHRRGRLRIVCLGRARGWVNGQGRAKNPVEAQHETNAHKQLGNLHVWHFRCSLSLPFD